MNDPVEFFADRIRAAFRDPDPNGHQLIWLCVARAEYATKPRLGVYMEENLPNRIQANEIKRRKHPCVMKIKIVEVPASVVSAMELILKVKSLTREAVALSQYLHARHPPCEKETQKQIVNNIQLEMESRFEFDPATLNEEEIEKLNAWCRQYVSQRLKQTTYNWQPVLYNENKALHYMLGRFAPEYAVLCSIFSELKKRDSDFQPHTLFDFGSGVGTVTWAARSIWGDSIN